MPFGDDIRIAREALNLSQAELARRVGIPRSMLRRVEQGNNATIETLASIAAQLPNLEAVHFGGLKLIPQNDLQEAVTSQAAAATALLESINRLVTDLNRFVTASAKLARTAEASGALAPAPGFQPLAWPTELPPRPELAQYLHEVDLSIDAGDPLVAESERGETPSGQ